MRNFLVSVVLAAAAAIGCAGGDGLPWFAGPRFTVVGDTLVGTGSLAELRFQSERWARSRPQRYSVDVSVGCFCGGDIRHPARIHVDGNVVTRAVALDDGRTLDASQFPTVDAIFAGAIATAKEGRPVRDVAYLRETGQIIHVTVGTPENDAGVFYRLGAARADG